MTGSIWRSITLALVWFVCAPPLAWSGTQPPPLSGPNSDFPDAFLVAPFDASANHTTFISISNVGNGLTTNNWVFFGEDGAQLIDVERDILGEGGTDVLDILNVRTRAIDKLGNVTEGPPTSLVGLRGFVTVLGDGVDRLVGNFTLANTQTLSAFGANAIGLGTIGTVEQGTRLIGTTFRPTSLQDDELIIVAVNVPQLVSLTNGGTPVKNADLLNLDIVLHSNRGDGVLASGGFAITGSALFGSLFDLFAGQSLDLPATIDVLATEGADYSGSKLDPDSDDAIGIIGWFGEAVGSFGAAQTLRNIPPPLQ